MNWKETFDHGMIMRYPATRWQDALPTGGGRVGALMYGQICSDTIVLNHDALYYPKPKPELVDVSDTLPEIRRMVSEGRYIEAEKIVSAANAARVGRDGGTTSTLRDPYQPLCAVRVHSPTEGPFRSYRRGVDFASGRIWMTWTDDTATFTREAFVSRVTDMFHLRMSSDSAGSVSCRLALTEHQGTQMDGMQWHGSGDVEFTERSTTAPDDHSLVFTASYPGGLSFGAVGSVSMQGGTLEVEGTEIVIHGADEVVFSVKLFVGDDPGTAVPRLLAENDHASSTFDDCFAEHRIVHNHLFRAMTLELGGAKRTTNEEMLMRAYEGEGANSLVQTMFEYGRYLFICSSKPGSWPPNLQGIWNGDYSPAWNSDFHTDENIQMNYWLSLAGGLQEISTSFYDYFERFIDDYRENASLIFGCRGIFIPIAQTTHGREVPSTWTNWTAAAGWIGQHFYDYFLFTGDKDFLRARAIPWLKEVALFYEDFLTTGDDGNLVFSPSLSPENKPTGENMGLVTMNATMDVAVCREALSNLCSGCELLGIEQENVRRWREMIGRLPEYEVNDDGAMKEWLHPSFTDNYHHRHQSHIYPLFPGIEITKETNPAIFKACRAAVEKRLVIGLSSQTGWSMAHMANIYARLGMGDRALECLEILTRSSTGPNLFTYHNDWRDMGLSLIGRSAPPFQIDANFGIAAAVLEMLVFSKPGMIKLLPALPEAWRSGNASGLRCRGGISADVEWDTDRAHFSGDMTSNVDQQVLLTFPAADAVFEPSDCASPSVEHGPGYWNVLLKAGESISIRSQSGGG